MKKTKRYRDEVKKQNNVQKTRPLNTKIEYTSLFWDNMFFLLDE